MYASDRGSVASISTAIGGTEAGERQRLSLEVIAQTDDPLLAETSVSAAIAAGRAQALCEQIARRIQSKEIVNVTVGREVIDTVKMVKGQQRFGKLRIAATCAVRQP
jgi:hypothetical protein